MFIFSHYFTYGGRVLLSLVWFSRIKLYTTIKVCNIIDILISRLRHFLSHTSQLQFSKSSSIVFYELR